MSAVSLEAKSSSVERYDIARMVTPEWIEPEIIRFRFSSKNRFDVHQVQSSGPYNEMLKFDNYSRRVGQLIDLDVDLHSGSIRHGHIRIDETLATIKMAANTLEFLPREQIFLFRSGDETSAPTLTFTFGIEEKTVPLLPWIRDHH